MGIRTRYLFIVLIAVLCVYSFTAIAQHVSYTQYYDFGAEYKEIVPDKIEELDEYTTKYTFYISDQPLTSRSIEFISTHENVEVYTDGTLFFERKNIESWFGKTPGSAINLVDIPVSTKVIEVIFKGVYDLSTRPSHSFYYGNGEILFDRLIRESLPSVAISALIITIGAMLIIFWIITYKRFVLNESLFHLAVFSIIIGLWSLNETDFAMVMVSNRVFCSIASYILLNLLIYPYINFARCFLQLKKDVCYYVLITISLTVVLILTALNAFSIADYRETSFVIHGQIALIIIYTVIGSLTQARRGLMLRKIKVHTIAALALSASILYNAFSFYQGEIQTDTWGKTGILLYIVILGLDNFLESYEQIDEVKKAKMYRNMAFTDLMTGLYNRSAFEKWEDENKDFTGCSIVTLDLNNLKNCNDTLGHTKGDLYITTVAECIHKVFADYGKCYRIGGDEFCVILKDVSVYKIENLINELTQLVEAENSKYEDIQFGVAVGMAIYNKSDANFEITRNRADEHMYSEKRRQKSGG